MMSADLFLPKTVPMTYIELSEVNDACTAALVDPTLGFSTHKMSPRFRPPAAAERKHLLGIIGAFRCCQDYEWAWSALKDVDWWWRLLHKKSRAWEAMLKEHVSGYPKQNYGK